MRVSRESLDQLETLLIVTLVTLGVTLTSMVWGAQSGLYLLCVLTAGFLSIIKLLRSPRKHIVTPAIHATILILLVLLSQGLIFQSGAFDFDITSSTLNVIAILIIIFVATALCTSSDSALKRAFYIAWTGHLALLIYGIVSGGLNIAQIGLIRFSGAGFREVIWAEVCLGTLALAVLTQRTHAIVLALPFTALLIAATQMRTVGIAAAVGILLFIYFRIYIKLGKSNRLVILSVFPILAFLYIWFRGDSILSTFSTILLLEDRYRGIASGFSGRIDNIILGWELFLMSPIIGVGSTQEDAAYVHNGYIKVVAQYGVFGFFWIALVGRAFWNAWRHKEHSLLAVLFMLALYYVGQPRHLSFQVFPLVGIFAVFLAVTTPTRGIENKTQDRK